MATARMALFFVVLMLTWCAPALGRRVDCLNRWVCEFQLCGTWEPTSEYVKRLDRAYGDCKLYNLSTDACTEYKSFALQSAEQSPSGEFICHHEAQKEALLAKYAALLPLQGATPAVREEDRDRRVPPNTAPEAVRNGEVVADVFASISFDAVAGDVPWHMNAGFEQSNGVVNGVDLSLCRAFPSYSRGSVAFPHCARYICAEYGGSPPDRFALQMQACCRFYSHVSGHLCWYYPIFALG